MHGVPHALVLIQTEIQIPDAGKLYLHGVDVVTMVLDLSGHISVVYVHGEDATNRWCVSPW
jgi:hypothetical protein